MTPAHDIHAHQEPGALEDGVPLVLLAVLVIGYVVLAYARSTEPRGWNPWRTAAFVTGAVLLALGLTPQTAPYPEGSLPSHMYQHLLLENVALLIGKRRPGHPNSLGRGLRAAPSASGGSLA